MDTPPAQSKINWENILIGVIIGAVLVGLGVLIWLVLQPKPEPTSPVTTKQSTPSAKISTPSAKKDETADWKTYKDDNISFSYPNDWVPAPLQVLGSSSVLAINDPDGRFSFSFTQRINYNQVTGEPYTSLEEYLNLKMESLRNRKVTINGVEGVQVLPRAGSENVNAVYFFSKEKKAILILELATQSQDEKLVLEGQDIFQQIISTFRFD